MSDERRIPACYRYDGGTTEVRCNGRWRRAARHSAWRQERHLL